MLRIFTVIFLSTILLLSCKNDLNPLPYIGQKKIVNGQEVNHTIPEWTYINQDSVLVTNNDLKPFVYVADFFFTKCPSICPRVMKEMLIIHKEFKNDPRVKLVSFTLDPKRDTPEKLTNYAEGIGANAENWWFLTGDEDETLDLANEYFVVAYKDDEVPGGFDHSGKLLLVDKEGHIRSFSEGTDPSDTPKMIKDIKKLLASYED